MSSSALSRYRAERLLRKDFAGLRSRVLAIVRSQLRAKGLNLDAADLEACYATAWHGLYMTVLDGQQVENPSAWLVLVTFRRAIDESRSAARQRHVGGAHAVAPLAPDLAEQRQGAASDRDVARELDDRARLRQVFEGLRSHLSARECEAASLCYLQGLSRAEAAERMGISESRMRKLMEGSGSGRPGVAGKVGELLGTIKAGGWCEQQSSLIRAFAFGVLEPGGERHTLATAHCRECPACRAHVASLRGLAAVLPLPLLSLPALAGGTGAAAGAGGSSRSSSSGATGAGSAGTARAGIGATRAGMGIGRGAPGSAWSGLAGSLTAKLAVTAVIVLGGGYALLGSQPHGNLPAARPGGVSSPVPSEALSQVLFTAPAKPPRGGLSSRRSTRTRTRTPTRARPVRVRRARSDEAVANHEFGPERVRREARSKAAAAAPARSHSSSPANPEFGIE